MYINNFCHVGNFLPSLILATRCHEFVREASGVVGEDLKHVREDTNPFSIFVFTKCNFKYSQTHVSRS